MDFYRFMAFYLLFVSESRSVCTVTFILFWCSLYPARSCNWLVKGVLSWWSNIKKIEL